MSPEPEPARWVAAEHDPRCIGLPGNSTEPEFTERLCDCRTLAMLDAYTEEGRARDRAALARVRHILSSGYGCLRCAEADLRAAVGLPPSEPHEHP